MTKSQWLNKARHDRDDLVDLIGKYHPVNKYKGRGEKLKITAPRAQAACDVVSENIRKNSEGDPVRDFDEAIEKNDVTVAYRILSDTWFGVPESTSCWQLKGFRETVDLMDEPPNEQ